MEDDAAMLGEEEHDGSEEEGEDLIENMEA